MLVLVVVVAFFAVAIGWFVSDQIHLARKRDTERGFRLISRRASQRLQFRPPKRSDRDFSIEMASDPVAAKANGWTGGEAATVTKRFADRKLFAIYRDTELVAFERSTGVAVGTASFSTSPLEPEYARSIGVHVHTDHRRKGYGREIMAAAITLLQYEPTPIHIGTRITNIGMQRVMTQLGYHPLPETRPYLAPNGEYYEAYWYNCSADTCPPAGLFEL